MNNRYLKILNVLQTLICNILMVYVCYMICRVAFVLENSSTLGNVVFDNPLLPLLGGCLMFDTSAIFYTNALYVLLLLFPCHVKGVRWQRFCKWVFVLLNGICISINLADSVYYTYTGRRTTMTVFNEFSNENNLSGIFGLEFMRHWYLVALGLLMIYGLWRCYRMPKPWGGKSKITYYVSQTLILALLIPLIVCGMRGGMTPAVRPITISNANKYVRKPAESALVLNTPFSLIRTAGKSGFTDPGYFSAEQLDAIYSPVHQCGNDTVRRKNVVVLIVESFGREYIGAYNENLEDGHYEGYTPFVDSLLNVSLSFDYTFANGRKSIDGMPSILSGIPHFVEPFFLTPSSLNDVSGIAGELRKMGYITAFFHGAENGSMGFDAFANITGFEKYFGRTEYNADKRFGGDADFDGRWAVWDEEFLQFYALTMSELHEPFATAVFTASSHHPYNVPEKYKDVYRDEPVPQAKGVIVKDNPMHKCIRYVDYSLRRFFATASRQPWFKNTIFVLTSDHTNLFSHEEYASNIGLFSSPILFFDPSGEMPRGRRHAIAQHSDIMPTVLGYIGVEKPFVAWGVDLLNTKDEDTWAVDYDNGIYMFLKGNHLLMFDGEKITGVFDFKTDWLLTNNLLPKLGNDPEVLASERQLKGIIQSYMQRMVGNELVVR